MLCPDAHSLAGGPSAIRTFVSDRFRPGLRKSVTPLIATCVCVIDVADTDFDTVAAQAWRSRLKAAKFAYFDTRDLWSMFDRVAAERGEEVDLLCYFNDLRRESAAVRPGPLPTPEEIPVALPLTTLTWGPHTDVPRADVHGGQPRAGHGQPPAARRHRGGHAGAAGADRPRDEAGPRRRGVRPTCPTGITASAVPAATG